MKKLISILCVILMLASSFTMVAQAGVGDKKFTESESNDTFATADVIDNDYTVDGDLATKNDIDYYKFVLTEESAIDFLCQSEHSTVLAGIYNSSEKLLYIADGYSNDKYYYDSTKKILSAGTYYICILQDSDYTKLSYLFYFSFTPVQNTYMHEHSYRTEVTIWPGCTTNGIRTYTCSCGLKYTETIPAEGHVWDEWEIVVEPTCKATGVQERVCMVCTVADVRKTVPATGHATKTAAGYEATCTKEGLTDGAYCPQCGEIFKEQNVIPKKAHDIVEYVNNATLTSDGSRREICRACNKLFSEEIIEHPVSFKLSSEAVVYNGKTRTPSVTVKTASGKALISGEDYDVIYHNDCRLPGKYNIGIVFKSAYSGEKALTFIIKPGTTKGVKANAVTSDEITLEWSETTGATGYRVYQYSPSKGKYVVKASVKDVTTYKVTGLKSGTACKFKIKPYVKSEDGTVIWGSASSAFTVTTKPTTPKLKSVTASRGKVTLNWNNVSGESGYQIYCSTSKNGEYKKMKSVSADTTKYTTAKLTAGKTYYFKVRAYVKVDGKTIFGDYSSIKGVKIK